MKDTAEYPEEFTGSVLDSLQSFSDRELSLATDRAGFYHDLRWLRLVECVDINEGVLGELRLRFIVVKSGGNLVAVCPFIITRSSSIVTAYSLEKMFFTSWRSRLARINPSSADWAPWAARFAEGYRRIARFLRTGSEGWVLAVSPLSVRGEVACVEMSSDKEQRVQEVALEVLKDVARVERLPLCFHGVQEDHSIRKILKIRGFDEVFYSYDNVIDLASFKNFEDYLDQFPGKVRRNHRAEMRRAQKACRFEIRRDFGAMAGDFESLYNATSSKYGTEYFHHPADFWRALDRHGGTLPEAMVAKQGDDVVGFCMLLRKRDQMLALRAGRRAAGTGGGPLPIYFSLVMYEPIKRAFDVGVTRLWLGQSVWEAKRRRGAKGYALYNYFWFPSLRARAVLGSFISAYGHISKQQIARLLAKDTAVESGDGNPEDSFSDKKGGGRP